MANTHSTLTELFTDIADSIRSKAGTSEPIVADAFPEAIDDIPSGGGGEDLDGLVMRTLTSFTGSQSMVGKCAFAYCDALISVSFSNCTMIGQSAFYTCKSLVHANFPQCISTSYEAFAYCESLTTINLQECEILENGTFSNCKKLTNISFPKLKQIGSMAFSNCNALSNVSFPKCQSIGASAFYACSFVTAIFPICSFINYRAFAYCKKLQQITIGTQYSSICKLSSSDAFSNCSALTSIYVPASLLTAYQTATNWTYFSSKMVGI